MATKYFIYLIIIVVFTHPTAAQERQIDYILKTETLINFKINPSETEGTIHLHVPFAGFEITNPEEISKTKGLTLTSISLIYTTYKESASFNQKELNKKRLESLQKLSPSWFSNPTIEWKVIAQKDSIRSVAYKTFNGFIIKYRKTTSEGLAKEEYEKLKELIDCETKFKRDTNSIIVSKIPASSTGRNKTEGKRDKKAKVKSFYKIKKEPAFANDPSNKALYRYYAECFDEQYKPNQYKANKAKNFEYSFDVKPDGSILNATANSADTSNLLNELFITMINNTPAWKEGKTNGNTLKYKIQFVILDKPQRLGFTDKKTNLNVLNLAMTEVIDTSHIVTRRPPKFMDSPCFTTDKTVINAFRKNPKWNKMLVVADYTGSMSRYYLQMMLWYKFNLEEQNKFKHFTFFNDGNKKSDKLKLIGKTGGIYHTNICNPVVLEKLAEDVVKAGNGGGDIPENDIEAILEGIAKCPDCVDIVWIADNYASPRDIKLMDKITKPVHVILCGTEGGVNPVFLDFVYKNKGTLHTMNNEIDNIMKLKEGDVISLEKRNYRLSNGKFSVEF